MDSCLRASLSGLVFMCYMCVFTTCSDLKNITARLGHNITLPCQAPTPFIAVEWTRHDLTPDIVFFYMRSSSFPPDQQHPSFVGRVNLLDRQMENGNLSLSLRNVSISDAGTYECRVQQDAGSRRRKSVIDSQPSSVINLTVEESGAEDEILPGGHVGWVVGLILGFLVFVCVAFGIFIKRKRHSEQSYDLPTNQM